MNTWTKTNQEPRPTKNQATKYHDRPRVSIIFKKRKANLDIFYFRGNVVLFEMMMCVIYSHKILHHFCLALIVISYCFHPRQSSIDRIISLWPSGKFRHSEDLYLLLPLISIPSHDFAFIVRSMCTTSPNIIYTHMSLPYRINLDDDRPQHRHHAQTTPLP